MEASQRIVVNTAVQYVRSAIYLVLTLLSTRYILLALGQSDFGIYAVIGSIVTLLGFLTTSLANCTQRFLSVTHGTHNPDELKRVFSNALFIHVVLALILVVLMVLLSSPILSYLRIPAGREQAEQIVYFMVVIMVALTFITSPIRALYIARENIVFVSLVEIGDAVLRFIGAICLLYIDTDSLILYAIIMAMLSVFNFVIYTTYAHLKYPECHWPKRDEISKQSLLRLSDFAIWNVYGVGATIIRTQGIAIVINRCFGTLINAAYGIALQVSNAISFLANSILSSMNPQLMKAEGAHDRQRMLALATKESRYSFMIMSLILIPMIMEMPAILHLWLGYVPNYATMFCRFVLLAFILDQITIGLTSANQAIGDIRNYNLIIGTLRIAILPTAFITMHYIHEPQWIMYIYIIVEIVCGLIRLPFLHHTGGLLILPYCRQVLWQNLPPILGNLAICLLCVHSINSAYRLFATLVAGMSVGCLLIWFTALSKEEKQWIQTNIIHKLKRL